MKTNQRYFKGLLAVFLCFMAIGCGPHRTTDADVKAVKNTLQQFYGAGMQVILETGKPEARYADMVGKDKYITLVKSVNGEDYSGIVVKADTAFLSVKMADGQEVVWTAPR